MDADEEQQVADMDHHPEAPDPPGGPLSPVRLRGRRLRNKPARYAEEQSSPQERKRLQSKAKYKKKEKANI